MTNPATFSEQVRESALCIAESGAAALTGLYDLTSMRLVRFSVTITRNQHDAEDAVQASLVRGVGNAKLAITQVATMTRKLLSTQTTTESCS